jgi:hypothetical protein
MIGLAVINTLIFALLAVGVLGERVGFVLTTAFAFMMLGMSI